MTTHTKLKIPILTALGALALSIGILPLGLFINEKTVFICFVLSLVLCALSFVFWAVLCICIGDRD